MMKYIWLLFMIIIVFRMIWRLAERSRAQGKLDGPWGGPSSGQGDLPWKRAPKGEEREYRPQLNIPEYLTRRGGDTTAGDTASKEKEKPRPAIEDGTAVIEKTDRGKKPEKCLREDLLGDTAVLSQCSREDQKEAAPRERNRHRGEADLFDDMICPGEVMKGIIWSQILGPRGGLRAKRR